MTRSPAARASAARDNLEFVGIYRPGAADRVRATIPSDVLDVIDHGAGSSWLEFEHDHWLMDGVMQVLGREQAIDCWHQSIGHLMDKPLLRSFVEGGLRLFGARPGKIIKLIPKGWPLAYRDFCSPSFELIEDGHAEIRFLDIAPQTFESEGYLYCWFAICQGVFDLEKPENGRVEFGFSASEREAIVTFRWNVSDQ